MTDRTLVARGSRPPAPASCWRAALSALLLSVAVAFGPTLEAFATGGGPNGSIAPNRPRPWQGVCTGIRGNGPRLFAHFTSLARITEEFGEISGAAGGSSGSISVFLTESIRANPLVSDCDGRRCGRLERRARQALLFKAIQGIQDAGLVSDILVVAELAQAVQAQNIEALLAEPATAQQGVGALVDILSDPAVRSILNPELFSLLQQSPDPIFHARDIASGLAGALSFRVDDPNVFLRPGVIDFAAFAEIVGRLGSFLAAVGPIDAPGMRSFLDACALSGLGLDWPDVAPLAAPGGTCGDRFATLFEDYLAARTPESPSRLDDPIGRFLPALVTTSVLEGPAVDAFASAKESYFAATPVPTLGIDFEDVRFGYWGQDTDLWRTELLLRFFFPDPKSRRFTRIDAATWREILQFSPAEPGLARALELPDGRVSAGGWTDPVPSQVLRSLGCRRVILVNRQDGIGNFTTDVASQLGATQDDLDGLFDLTDPRSGFTSALRTADGVWCTNWDAPGSFDIRALSAEGWDAPLETRRRRFLRYENASRDLGVPGCSPGLAP